MRELYEKIKKGTDRRASLIALKKELKDEAKKKVFLTMTGNRLDEIMKCLVDEDRKVRKKAAAIYSTHSRLRTGQKHILRWMRKMRQLFLANYIVRMRWMC